MTVKCGFRDCRGTGQPSLRIAVSPAPDGDIVVIRVHDVCVADMLHAAASPDDPRDHGRIPAAARCAFCNERLPVIGKHPVSFDVGMSNPPDRFWSHVRCLVGRVRPRVAERISNPHPPSH